MFSTSANIKFVFGYACLMCICLTTAIWLFWDKVGLFVVKTVWQPCEVHRALLGIVNKSI